MNQAKFDEQFSRFLEMSVSDGRFSPQVTDHFPHLADDGVQGYDPHYVLHTGWAARKLAASHPAVHHDFGSSLFFVSMASAFTSFFFHDIRNPDLPFKDIYYEYENLTALSFADGDIYSMSCLHVLEHVGLGRYGDELDAGGDRKAAKELARVLSPGGQLLIVVPMEDPPRIQFNAHRLYSYEQVMELFSGLTLTEFSLITNEYELFPRCLPDMTRGRKYACGCFRFTK